LRRTSQPRDLAWSVTHLGRSQRFLFLAVNFVCIVLSGCSIIHPRAQRAHLPLVPVAVEGVPGGVPGGTIVIGEIATSVPAVTPKSQQKVAQTHSELPMESESRIRSPQRIAKPIAVADLLDSRLEAVVRSATEGSIKYNPPQEMKEGAAVKISAQLLRPDGHGSLGANPGSLLGPGEVRTETLKISEEMRLTLTSVEADGFDIKEDDTSHQGIQTVLPGGGANWYWDITPRRAGQLHLRLTASIVIRSGGDERHQDFATFDNTVMVSVLRAPQPSLGQRTWTAAVDFGMGNWKWLLGLLPLGEMTRRLSQRSKGARAVISFYSRKTATDEERAGANRRSEERMNPNAILEVRTSVNGDSDVSSLPENAGNAERR
jgi:hypothetical protein